MTGEWVRRLLEVASPPLAPSVPAPALAADGVVCELSKLLGERYGFYAFESALHVYGSGSSDVVGGSLESWNAADGWIAEYRGLADGLLFFAEDVFGTQFALRGERVHTFDPETGATREVASNIEEWAHRLLDDYEYLTGQPVGRSWQLANRALLPGERLVPIRPFVLGGEFETSNLQPMEAGRGMRQRARLAVELRDLPDGAQVRWPLREQTEDTP